MSYIGPPLYDENYHERNEPRWRPAPEHHECECGAELTRDNPPLFCDVCEMQRCAECMHICSVCERKGCYSCQTDTGDGWQCNEHVAEGRSVEVPLMNNALDAIYGAMGKETRQ